MDLRYDDCWMIQPSSVQCNQQNWMHGMHLQQWWPIFLAISKLRITDSRWATSFKLSRCLGAVWVWKYISCIAMWTIFLTILVQWARNKEKDSIRTSKQWKRGIKGTGVGAWWLTMASVSYASAQTLHTLGQPKKENSCLRYVSSLRYLKLLALFCFRWLMLLEEA